MGSINIGHAMLQYFPNTSLFVCELVKLHNSAFASVVKLSLQAYMAGMTVSVPL